MWRGSEVVVEISNNRLYVYIARTTNDVGRIVIVIFDKHEIKALPYFSAQR